MERLDKQPYRRCFTACQHVSDNEGTVRSGAFYAVPPETIEWEPASVGSQESKGGLIYRVSGQTVNQLHHILIGFRI
jgi:hypothetical protein